MNGSRSESSRTPFELLADKSPFFSLSLRFRFYPVWLQFFTILHRFALDCTVWVDCAQSCNLCRAEPLVLSLSRQTDSLLASVLFRSLFFPSAPLSIPLSLPGSRCFLVKSPVCWSDSVRAPLQCLSRLPPSASFSIICRFWLLPEILWSQLRYWKLGTMLALLPCLLS